MGKTEDEKRIQYLQSLGHVMKLLAFHRGLSSYDVASKLNLGPSRVLDIYVGREVMTEMWFELAFFMLGVKREEWEELKKSVRHYNLAVSSVNDWFDEHLGPAVPHELKKERIHHG